MKNKVRKGLHDIVTRGALSDDAQNPQRKFLAAASLELKKTLCDKVRDAARKRIAQMDQKIAELDAEIAQVLGDARTSAPGRPAEQSASPPGRGFTLKY
jgi:hypothetical protein